MLIPEEDRDALALGRGILTVTKALGALARGVLSASSAAADDMQQTGMRGAIAGSLRRAAAKLDRNSGYVNDPPFPPPSFATAAPRSAWSDPAAAPWSPTEEDIDQIDEAFFDGSDDLVMPDLRAAPQAMQTAAVTNPLFDRPGHVGVIAHVIADHLHASLTNNENERDCARDIAKSLGGEDMATVLACTDRQVYIAGREAAHMSLGAVNEKYVVGVMRALRSMYVSGASNTYRGNGNGYAPFSSAIGPTPADDDMIESIVTPRPDAQMAEARIEPWPARNMDDADDDHDRLGGGVEIRDDESEERELSVDAEEQAMRDLDESVGV